MEVSTKWKTLIPKAGGLIALQVIEVKPVQLRKASLPMFVTFAGIITEVKFVQ